MADFDDVTVGVSSQSIALVELARALAQDPNLVLGGVVRCRDNHGDVQVMLSATGDEQPGPSTGALSLRNGAVTVGNFAWKPRVSLWSQTPGFADGGMLLLYSADDAAGVEPNGDPKAAVLLDAARRLLRINAKDGHRHFELSSVGSFYRCTLGGGGLQGDLVIFNKDNAKVAELGPTGNLYVGGHGVDGDVIVKDAAGTIATQIYGRDRQVLVRDSAGKVVITLSGNDGTITARDVVLENADCAEDFEAAGEDLPEAGELASIDDEGRLCRSREAYDRRVAGVISGAGDYRAGVILGRKETQCDRVTLALVGKVFCKVDAGYGAVAVGDLLTTSPTPGHAMKAADPARAFGAVVGKALRPLAGGAGLIPILVALQ